MGNAGLISGCQFLYNDRLSKLKPILLYIGLVSIPFLASGGKALLNGLDVIEHHLTLENSAVNVMI